MSIKPPNPENAIVDHAFWNEPRDFHWWRTQILRSDHEPPEVIAQVVRHQPFERQCESRHDGYSDEVSSQRAMFDLTIPEYRQAGLNQLKHAWATTVQKRIP